jgi:hypothetical protein
MLFLIFAEPGQNSPEPVTDTLTEHVAKEVEDEPGSFSPELVQDYDGDEVVDPETDKANLVSLSFLEFFIQSSSLHTAECKTSTAVFAIQRDILYLFIACRSARGLRYWRSSSADYRMPLRDQILRMMITWS